MEKPRHGAWSGLLWFLVPHPWNLRGRVGRPTRLESVGRLRQVLCKTSEVG
jgi:hypothetical protein